MKVENLLNKKFNQLTIIKFIETRGKSRHAYWLCRCSCGNEKILRVGHLKSGQVKSCGCLSRKKASVRFIKYANSKAHKGEGNPQWKGDEAKVSAIHNWLARHFTKEKCSKCDSVKTLDWALKTGKKYSHNKNNFLVLCRSCHFIYDYKSGIR